MTKLQPMYTIKNVNGHIEIFDFFNRFICSGDNEKDAMDGFDEAYEALERRFKSRGTRKSNDSFTAFTAEDKLYQ